MRDATMSTRCLVLLLVAWPALLAGQAAPVPAVRDEISVELVNVEVHVTGADGRPVSGLERAAFRLSEDGRPVEITHFAWVPALPGRAPGESRAADASAPGGGRRIALFFDEAQVGDRSRAPLIAELERALRGHLDPADSVELVRFDGAETERLLGWTTDRGKLSRALAELGAYSPRRLAMTAERLTFIEYLDQEIKPGAAKGISPCLNVGQIVRSYADLVKRDVEGSAAALLRYSHHLANQPGRHLLFHVSDGIPMIAGGELYQYAIDMCGGDAAQQGVPNAFENSMGNNGYLLDRFDPHKARLDFADYVMAPLWTDVTARINALGVTVYAIQAASAGMFPFRDQVGVVPPATAAMVEQNPADTLSLLAQETGGLMVRAARGLEDEIGRVVDDLGGYYTLAFVPPADGKAGLRRLQVEVDREGVELRHRRSYRLQSRDERIVGQLVELFDAEAVDNPLGLRIGLRRAAEETTQRLQVIVPFQGLTMIPAANGSDEGRFTVFLTLRDEEGGRGGVRQRTIAVVRPDPRALSYTYEIELPDEKGEVAVAVVDDYSGTVAFARERIPAR